MTVDQIQHPPLRDRSFTVDFSAREITGVVRRSRVVNDGFAIVTLDGNRQACGELSEDADIVTGVCYRWFGSWAEHPKYGPQFRFTGFTVADSQEQMGVVAYLTKKPFEFTRGVAMKIWSVYGKATLDAIREQRDAVVASCGLTDQDVERLNLASDILQEHGATEKIKVELHELFAGRGFTAKTVRDCIAKFGVKAPAIIRRSPFRMLVSDVSGVGFKRADKMYLDLGGNPARLKRQLIAGWDALRNGGSGNTWERDNVINAGILRAVGDVSKLRIEEAIELGLRAKWLACRLEGDVVQSVWGDCDTHEVWYADGAKAAAEARLAKHIARIMTHAPIWPEVTEADLADEHQRAALASLRHSPIAILAGTPGTGKTFTAAALIKLLKKNSHTSKIAVCAPTGKAAVRITESLRKNGIENLTATTVHQLLEVEGNAPGGGFEFFRNETNPLEFPIVAVDEVSMLDTDLASSLFAAIPAGGCVLLIGDPFQLPPVGHGAPLRDMIEAGIPMALLTEIKRNSGAIVKACAAIKDGRRFETFERLDGDEANNLLLSECEDEETQVQVALSILDWAERRGFDPTWDVQILVATNDKSLVSRKKLNPVVQNRLNPAVDGIPAEHRNDVYRVGDKVICLKNSKMTSYELIQRQPPTLVESYTKNRRGFDHYVANGDMGRVLAVNPTSMIVQFSQPDRVVLIQTKKKKRDDDDSDTGGRGDFDLAYAMTIHKSQGSEFPVVIIMLDESAGPLGCRELIYTAISRASKFCFLVGRGETARRWAGRAGLTKRKTFLVEDIIKLRTEVAR